MQLLFNFARFYVGKNVDYLALANAEYMKLKHRLQFSIGPETVKSLLLSFMLVTNQPVTVVSPKHIDTPLWRLSLHQ